MRSLSFDKEAVRAVARAIAGVVAKRVVQDDPKLAKLDGLGKVMATNTMADGMVGSLSEEAIAAIEAVERLLEGADAPRAA